MISHLLDNYEAAYLLRIRKDARTVRQNIEAS
jgi:hypothetical protein